MKELLFLCHRMPYPPNKGDKIRAYHWLKALSSNYRVHLGTFVDDPSDWAHRDTLEQLTDRCCYRSLRAFQAKMRSLRGLLSGGSLSMGYYHDRVMAAWVDEIVETRPIEAVVVFSSTMAPYVAKHRGCPRLLDFVDVDSDKWRQYAAQCRGPSRWVFAREARRLASEERRLAAAFDASVFVSPAEAAFFRASAPESADRVFAVGNGVDSVFFDPALAYADPYGAAGDSRILFTGAMDYAANVDAVCWFAAQVWPRIIQRMPNAQFWIVGARPQRAVESLAAMAGVHVTGTVDDVRPYLAHADVCVAPMRIARGIQNKVLEALAMGRPVVMTQQAAAGLEQVDARAASVTQDPQAFADAVVGHAQAPQARTPLPVAREYAIQRYGWARQFERLQSLVGQRRPVVLADTSRAYAHASGRSA